MGNSVADVVAIIVVALILADLAEFFGVLGGVVDGFAERASAVTRLLGDPATTFLIISRPEPASVEEAIFLRRRLAQAGMPFGRLVVNRVRLLAPNPQTINESTLLEELHGDRRLAAKSIRALDDLRALERRDAADLQPLSAELADTPPILVPQLAHDISDMAGLVAAQRFLFAAPREHSALLAEQGF